MISRQIAGNPNAASRKRAKARTSPTPLSLVISRVESEATPRHARDEAAREDAACPCAYARFRGHQPTFALKRGEGNEIRRRFDKEERSPRATRPTAR